MRIGAFTFSPGLWPTVGAVALIALTLWLARWQTERGDEKAARQSLLEARIHDPAVVLSGAVAQAEPLLYRRVRASGEWIPAGQIFVDNQVLDGKAGFDVVTPLRLAGGDGAVLVNRGWVARGPEYPRAPAVPVPAGRVEVSGTASLPPRRFLELSADTVAGGVWQNLSIERYRERFAIPVLPVVILSEGEPGLVPIHESPDSGEAKHREYALTWLSLAVTTLVLWLALNVKRREP
ncbi:MAG: SURF1 family protein [Usitatibacter sp.]